MKIAYLFVGHSRTWDKCYRNFFNHVYNIAPGDIYIHTWNKVNTSYGSHWNGWIDLTGDKLDISNKTPDFEAISNAYNPKLFLIEEEPPIIEMKNNYASVDGHLKNKATSAVRNILTSLRNLFEKVKQSDNYDKFFCTRMDIKYLSDLNYKDLECSDLMSPNVDVFNDVWIVGNQEQIDIKTKYVYHIDEYWYNSKDYNVYTHEECLKQYLKDNNVTCKNLDLKYEIVRLF